MATNNIYAWRRSLSVQCTAPATPASSDPVLFGQLPGVALTDEDADGYTTVAFDGVWALPVTAKASADTAVSAGDVLYYDAGAISRDSSGVPYGVALDAVAAGATSTIGVLLGFLPGQTAGSLVLGDGSQGVELTLRSSFAGGEDEGEPGQFDSTSRINLESYQRADFRSYGEVLRIYSRRADSKQMVAWYGPTSFNMATREPVGPDRPWFWMGAHYEANDHGSTHGHWSCEVPDTNGALQTRFEMKIWNPVTGQYGMDKTNILTNAADFTVRCTNGQVLRLSANGSHHKDIQFGLDHDGADASQRWRIRVTSADADLQVMRYDNTGGLQDAPLTINRGTGKVTIGGSSGTAQGLDVIRNGGTALTVTQLAAGATVLNLSGADAASRAFQSQVTGDTFGRFSLGADGALQWGSGAAARDVTLYRSSADVLKTDDTLHVDGNLRVRTTSLGGGSGVVAIGNAAVVPSSDPAGGGVLYAEGGALLWRGSLGTVTTIAPA